MAKKDKKDPVENWVKGLKKEKLPKRDPGATRKTKKDM